MKKSELKQIALKELALFLVLLFFGFVLVPVAIYLVGQNVLGQFGGNVMFQWSLGVIGIALTVPLCMGAIILCSALLGRIFVNESVTPGALVSMLILIG